MICIIKIQLYNVCNSYFYESYLRWLIWVMALYFLMTLYFSKAEDHNIYRMCVLIFVAR